jgi:hypothetical protein
MSYSDAETNQRLKIPANTFTLPALMIVSTGNCTRPSPAPISFDPGNQLILFGF